MKRILYSAGTAWIGRVLGMAVNLVGIPVVYRDLGAVRFGIFLIVLNVGAWIGLVNFGFGRAVAVVVARYLHKSKPFVGYTLTMATLLSAVVNLIIFILCCLILFVVAWGLVTDKDLVTYRVEFVIGTVVVFASLALWYFLSIFEGIDAGQERLYRLYLFQNASYIITLVLLLTVFRTYPSVPLAAFLLGAGFLLGSVMQSIYAFWDQRDLFVRLTRRRWRLIRAMFATTLDFTAIFFALGIIYYFLVGIIGLLVGPEEFVDLGVFMRIVSALLSVIFALTYPMSSSITANLARGDQHGAVRAARWTGVLLVSIFAAGSVGFLLFGEAAISIWLSREVRYDLFFRSMGALLIFLSAAHAYLQGILVGLGHMRLVARINMVEAAALVPISYVAFLVSPQAGILFAINTVLLLVGMMGLWLFATRRRNVDSFMTALLRPV